MSKPSIFISSTIKDFKDIRNGVKFWLEELGFEVFLSESPDLARDPKLFTIESCMDLVRKSDIYILIVGDYKGWTPPEEKLSITHLEFEEALKDPKKPIHVFVEEKYDTKFKEDPSTVTTRDLLTGLYTHKGKTGANWVNLFKEFSDISSVLKATLGLSKSISRKALEKMVIKELKEFLKTSIIKEEGKLRRPCDITQEMVNRFNLDKSIFLKNVEEYTVKFTKQDMRDLAYLNFTYIFPRFLRHPSIHFAATSEHFITFDRNNGSVEVSGLLELLQSLSSNLNYVFEQTNMQKAGKNLQEVLTFFEANKDASNTCMMPVKTLGIALSAYIRFSRTYLEAESIYNHLVFGDEIDTPSLKTFLNSPFKNGADKPLVDEEKITDEDLKTLRDFITSHK